MLEPQVSMFKSAMRQLATTVSVVSTAHGGSRYGMTATAVASVSMDPPSLLVCINRDATIHGPIQAKRQFWLNVLHEGQEQFCSVFAGGESGERRFSNGSWGVCQDGLPYLTDAKANILCDVKVDVPYGTHTVFIAEVLRVMSNVEIRPLVYFQGGFADVRARSGAR